MNVAVPVRLGCRPTGRGPDHDANARIHACLASDILLRLNGFASRRRECVGSSREPRDCADAEHASRRALYTPSARDLTLLRSDWHGASLRHL
jgi:hypothetical protein